ncbi:hypothetical protein B0H13DRAFT_2036080 [Mycena leptocephala]|nr:hypothetical protein B0H13DRAFT_2036080 [Mycena leptocephala]
MPFESLGDDILLHVLSFCNVYTALLVSRINKSLHAVALTKQLWLNLVRELGLHGVLDLPSTEELENYSTGDLIGTVKRVVVGPYAWSTSAGRATLYRQLTLDPDVQSRKILDFQLLPGGRYMVLRMPLDMYIYEVATSRRVWQHALAVVYPHEWSVDLLPGGRIARILLVPGVPHISVEELDLTSGQCGEAFSLHLPPASRCTMPSIAGDFLVCALRSTPGPTNFLLVNWRAETYIILDYGGHPEYDVSIFSA